MKEADSQYLRDLAARWRRSEGGARRETIENLFREVLVGLGTFSREEMEVFCRGVSVAALATVMASLARGFEDPDEVLQFVQLLACRAAVEAENARQA